MSPDLLAAAGAARNAATLAMTHAGRHLALAARSHNPALIRIDHELAEEHALAAVANQLEQDGLLREWLDFQDRRSA